MHLLLHLLNPLRELFDPAFWTAANTIAFAGAVIAIVSLAVAYWPLRQQHRTQRLLEQSFGADFYDLYTIKQATRYYVRPHCASVDPTQEAEIRHSLVTREDLFLAVDRYLSDNSVYRHILLLADSGMGKTSFVLNYYARNQKLPKRKRHRLAVVPLGIPNTLEEIKKIENKKDTVIFLDAFDEDTKAIQDHKSRLIELMEACAQFKRVLITCRTQFFPSDEEIPRETGIARVGPRKPGESGGYEFWKLYLMPLDDSQVKTFLRRRYPIFARGKRKRALALVNKVPLLSVRPMLLSYIPDLLQSAQQITFAFQIYEVMIEKWLEREKHWVEPEVLRSFSKQLAVDLYINREKRGAERISKQELLNLIEEKNIKLDDWKATGRSLLNRDAQGSYKFAHRSVMEYLFIKSLTEGNEDCLRVEWTDLMQTFLSEMGKARTPFMFAHINELQVHFYLHGYLEDRVAITEEVTYLCSNVNAKSKISIPWLPVAFENVDNVRGFLLEVDVQEIWLNASDRARSIEKRPGYRTFKVIRGFDRQPLNSIIEPGFALPFTPLGNEIEFFVRMIASYWLPINGVLSRSLSMITRSTQVEIRNDTWLKIDVDVSGIKANIEHKSTNPLIFTNSASILLPGASFTIRFFDSKNEQPGLFTGLLPFTN